MFLVKSVVKILKFVYIFSDICSENIKDYMFLMKYVTTYFLTMFA